MDLPFDEFIWLIYQQWIKGQLIYHSMNFTQLIYIQWILHN